MIGGLLKDLALALVRYVAYHVKRMLGMVPVPPTALETKKEAGAPSELPENFAIGLDPTYLTLVDWPAYRHAQELPELLRDPLYQLWMTDPNGHKWSHYFGIYQAVFGTHRDQPMRILEIGVLGGASLALWRKYFAHPETVIVGIDIQEFCRRFDAPEKGIHVRIGSQADEPFLKTVVAEFGPFDLIIDDGSHRSTHMITSFNALFASGLKDSGMYLVEDLHANYWPGWRDSEKSFLDLCKELAELMHAHYPGGSPPVFLKNGPEQALSIRVPVITTMIREIRFFDSIVTIQKEQRRYIPYYALTQV